MLVTATVPRLSPLTIRRPRLERWLSAYGDTPVRLIIAPAGFGKSSLLLKYAAGEERDVAYCALPQGCGVQELRSEVVRALSGGKAPRTYEAFIAMVNGSPAHCREIIIDDADNASKDGIAELLRLVDDVAENVTLIYAARSRERIEARRITARGIAVACDARMLAFDGDETATFAEACGASVTDLDVRRLVEETDGWAIPLCGAVRVAAAEGTSLMNGYERWRARSSVFLHELVASELQRVEEPDRALFLDLLNGSVSVKRERLYELASRGLFLYDNGTGEVRLQRALRRAGQVHVDAAPQRTMVPLNVRMFRSFDASIGGRAIPWVRRRDQQIIKYLLLKTDGRASRAEIASVFWDGIDRHLATQSVRTACSTIRKAIAAIVGHADVDHYFRTSPDLQIDLNNVVCDVRRFIAHVNDADSAYSNSDLEGAAMHYRAAAKLYDGGLLEFEAFEPWFGPQARALHERFVIAIERLADLAIEQDALEDARQYAQRARAAAPDAPSVANLCARIESARRRQFQPARRMNSAYVESV
jgi:DNA-binding SARP family transcriptional activator